MREFAGRRGAMIGRKREEVAASPVLTIDSEERRLGRWTVD